jgi:hypothetical protein
MMYFSHLTFDLDGRFRDHGHVTVGFGSILLLIRSDAMKKLLVVAFVAASCVAVMGAESQKVTLDVSGAF